MRRPFFKMNINTPNKANPWLCRFAGLTAFATFLLIGLGGLVTSHGAGMSVPDWPNTYGYNMFAFPISKWVGGIFYEHTHRLLATAVGLLTTILAVWLWIADARRWMRWLGVAAFLGVVVQGILGGLRVTLHMDSLGIFHATIAQLFFILVCAIALFTSRFWAGLTANKKTFFVPRGLRMLVLATTFLIFIQLIIAATMRHQHAGLAISDFPLAYGKIWPDTSAAAVAGYNAHRVSVTEEASITAFQIQLQMAHRVAALAILILVAACAWQARRRLGKNDSLAKLAMFWLAMILGQVVLGAATIWTNKAADVATAHVMVGALSLVTGALWCLIGFGRSVASLPAAPPLGVFGVQTSMMANK
jgi:cytochrome c oxidase assembly protein subunit 15